MDPITQGALGAACAQAALYNKDKRNAWLVGALAGMAADIDVFIRSSHDPLLLMLYHRNFTHSLFFIPVGALIVTLILMLFKRFRVNWRLTFWAALIGYATHGLLDAFTNYGTLLYWPFSNKRVSWDIVSIIDPFFTFPLILGVYWTLKFNNKKGVLTGLALAGLFLIFNGYQHYRAINAVHRLASQNNWTFTRLRVFPKLASSIYWRGILQAQEQMWVLNVSTPLFSSAKAEVIKKYPLFKPELLPDFVTNSSTLLRDFTVFDWFSDHYLILANPQPLTLADGRFLEEEKANVAFWGIQFLPNESHVRRYNNILLKK